MVKKNYEQPCTVFLILPEEEYRQNILCAGNSVIANFGMDAENNCLPLIYD